MSHNNTNEPGGFIGALVKMIDGLGGYSFRLGYDEHDVLGINEKGAPTLHPTDVCLVLDVKFTGPANQQHSRLKLMTPSGKIGWVAAKWVKRVSQ